MTYDTIGNDKTIAGGEGALLANRYRIVRQLGQGGMGSVWLVEDTQLDDKPFAVKMLPSILVSNKRAYRQLKDEALVAMRLVHPHIVQIRAFEENDGNPFLVMDYVDGQTLDDYLCEECKIESVKCKVGGGICEDEVIRILKPIAAALDYAHAKGVVHRDVKPGNVMIAKDGTPYILDFGIAREIQETMTRVTGKLSSGTLLYMSPEQLMGESPKPAQDIYSFAAMAYECLKGEPPFSHGQIEFQIMNKQPSPPPGGTQLVASVMAGLAKKPEDRPATCAAVLGGKCLSRAERVDSVRRGTSDTSQPGRARSPSAPPEPQPGRAVAPQPPQGVSRSRATAAILSAVAFLALCGVIWYRNTQRQELSRRSVIATQQTAVRQQEEEKAKRAEEAARKKADAERRMNEESRAKEEAERRRKTEEERLAAERRARESATEVRIEAKVQQGKITRISDADGFKARKDSLEEMFVRAEAFYGENMGRWTEAESLYREYIKQSKSVVVLDGERQQAVAKRSAAQDAFRNAEAEGAKTYASGSWNDAVKTWNSAATEFRRMEFVAAAAIFAEAMREFNVSAGHAKDSKRAEEEKKRQMAEQERLAEARVLFKAGHKGIQLWEGGPYWAETNIGAEKPEDYGYYFWWGDTVGYKREGDSWVASDGSSSYYSFAGENMQIIGKDFFALKREGWITGENVLVPQHDVAQVQWGGGWRIPTEQELDDLASKCDWTWTTMNGVNGYVVRGRGDYAFVGIFLPAAGFGDGTSLDGAGSNGFYWSSVPTSGIYYDAWALYFDSGDHDTDDRSRRSSGQSIRPVQGFTK